MNYSTNSEQDQPARHAFELWVRTALPNCIRRTAKLLTRTDLASLDGWGLCVLVARHALPGDVETPNYEGALRFRKRLGAPDDLRDEAAFWRTFIECVARHRQRPLD